MTPDDFRLRTEAFIEKFSLPDGSVKPRRHVESELGRNAGPGDAGHGDDDKKALAPARHGDEGMANEHQMGRVRTPIGLLELVAAYRAYSAGEISAQAFAEVQQQAVAGVRERSMGTTGERHQAAGSEPVAVRPAHDEAEAEHGGASPGDDDAEPIDIYMMAMRYAYEPEVLRLEADVPYRFRIMSMDANHGVSINVGVAGHIMRRPARTMAAMTMTFTEPGEYLVYCTVYCGLGHDMMKGKIIVE
jgi:plastocyanin